MDRIFVALVFLLPVPTFGLMAWVTRTLGAPELLALVGSPLWWALQIVVTAGAVVVALRGVARFPGGLASAAEVEAAQKGLVVFPKLVLAGGLVYGLVIAGLVALCVPAAGARWGELLIVGYSNAIFFSMPPYILFLQRFERRNRSVPFSEHHLSMNIPLRVSLVSAFVLTSMLAALLVAFHNLGTTAGQDTWSAVLAVGLPIGVVGLAVGLMNLGLLMRGIVERIEGARAFVGALAEGQVAQRPLEMSSRDELGVLSHRLNLVQGSLGELLGHTRDSVDRTVDVKDELLGICGAATEEVGRIGHLVRRTDERFEHILAQSAEVLTRVERFHGLSADLNGEVNRQIEMVEETSSALTQMTEAIEEVARLSASRVEAAQALEAKTADGGRQMTGTLGQLNEIATSVQDIRAITGLIQTIAAQTNLLAMNAAIEAAHAGSAGAGFAVVADEIRKLAENAARNSREITQKVKSIVQNIGTTVEAGRRTSDTFAELNAELGDFLKFFRSIESAVGDMRAGSQSILSVSSTLQTVSAGVEQRASAVDQEADGLFKDMEALAADARQAREAMTEVDASVGQVTEAAGRLKDHSQRLDASTRDVSDQVGRFRLE